MDYSIQQVSKDCLIVREHESGGFGDPWTGWSCVVKKIGCVAFIMAAPTRPKSVKKLCDMAWSHGFRFIVWIREKQQYGHKHVVIDLEKIYV